MVKKAGGAKKDVGADRASETPPLAAAAAPAAAPGGGKRRSGRTAGGAKKEEPPPAAAEAPAPPPSKKRKAGRLAADGGTTSAAALAETGEEPCGSPLSPLGPAPGDAMDVDGGAEGPYSLRDNDHLLDTVVKVFCVHSEPNFSLPWQRKRQYSSTGSGFVISGRRILTNAHCVDHNTQVKVKRRGSDTKYVAQVLAVGTECDIAMLTVEDEGFWEGMHPVQFGPLPRLQDSVTVVGYPIGGDTMSVTSGVVSRIEVTPYVHGTSELLGVQVDAAINAGNSGGPAFSQKGLCVGIAFQSLKSEDTENISWIIPTPVVSHFIDDYERHGRYTGFPSVGIEWQKMESPVLRSALGMKKNQRGVLVRRVEPTSAASEALRQGDILLSFDSVEIGNDGTVPFRSGERIGFSYLISQKYMGDEAKLTLLRDGEQLDVTLQLRGPRRLIPVHINNRPPSYYILAGLVFTPVTIPFLKSEYGKEFDYDAPVRLLDKLLHAMAENTTQQVVVLSQVLASDSNVGYEDIVNTQVFEVNGTKVNNLRELMAAVEAAPGPFLRFDLDYNQVVILDRESALAATPDILVQHCIPSDRSEDLKAPGGEAAPKAGVAQEEEDHPGDREAGAAKGERGGFIAEPSD